jgi:plasmid stabilization system protein ParE
MMKYRFHPEALQEFQAAAIYYDKQQRGLGLRFTSAIQTAIEHVVTSPLAWRILDEEVRRYLTKVFPYAVLYTVESDYVLIVAVMHCHREPDYWQHRV